VAPSEEHVDLAKRVYPWLNARATRAGVAAATEVYLGDGYLADVVARCAFQDRFFTRYCKAWRKEPLVSWGVRSHGEVVDDFICVFEVKVSRADFLSTFSRDSKGHENRHEEVVGHLHWVVAEPGIVRPNDEMGFWGLLERSGNGLHENSIPVYCQLDDEATRRASEQLLLTLRSRGGLEFK